MKEGLKQSLAALAVVVAGITAEGRAVAHPGKTSEAIEVDPDEEIIVDGDKIVEINYANDPDALFLEGNGCADEINQTENDGLNLENEEDVEDHPTVNAELLNRNEQRKGRAGFFRYIDDVNKSLLRWQYGSKKRAEDYFRKSVDPIFRERVISLVAKHVNKANEDLPPHLRITSSLVLGLIAKESNFKTNLVSKAGARGLCQFIPASAERVGVNVRDKKGSWSNQKINDPDINIEAGVKILARFILHFNSIDFGVAAYNAGDVSILRKIIEFSESRKLDIVNQKSKKIDKTKILEHIKTRKINLQDVLDYYLLQDLPGKDKEKKVRGLLYPYKVRQMEEIINEVWFNI